MKPVNNTHTNGQAKWNEGQKLLVAKVIGGGSPYPINLVLGTPVRIVKVNKTKPICYDVIAEHPYGGGSFTLRFVEEDSLKEIPDTESPLPATAPANGEEWSRDFRKFIESSIVWDRSYPDGFNQDAVEDYIRTLKLKWEEAERERIQAEKNTLSAVLLFMFYANQKTRSEIQEIIGKNLDNPHTKDIAEDLMMNIGVIQSPLHYSILKFANKYIDIQSKKINHKELERLLQESIASIAEGGGKE